MIGRMVIASILPLPLTTPTNVPQWIYGNISAMRIKTKRWTNVIDELGNRNEGDGKNMISTETGSVKVLLR